MKDLADINNQFHTLLRRIDEVKNFKEKLTKELLKYIKTPITVNDEILNLKDSNYTFIEEI